MSAYAHVKLTGLGSGTQLNGRRVTTRLTKSRLRSARLDFSVPSSGAGFEEVSAYYHVNEAIAYLERLGYRGPRRLFTRPLEIDARGTRDDNSWYSPGERTLTFGTGDVDDAEDGETVLHEGRLHLRIDPRADGAPWLADVASLARALAEAGQRLAAY